MNASASESHNERGTARQGDEAPADVLGEVWEALDVLPRSAAAPSMTATTIEMAAVASGGRMPAAPTRSPGSWLIAATVVAGCFAIGLVAGRASLPWGELRPQMRFPPRQAIRQIIEEELERQRQLQRDRPRDFRRGPRPPEETPAPPR